MRGWESVPEHTVHYWFTVGGEKNEGRVVRVRRRRWEEGVLYLNRDSSGKCESSRLEDGHGQNQDPTAIPSLGQEIREPFT